MTVLLQFTLNLFLSQAISLFFPSSLAISIYGILSIYPFKISKTGE